MNTPYTERFNQIASNYHRKSISDERIIVILNDLMFLSSAYESIHLEGIDIYITPEQCPSSNKEL